jgi:hypothetical protein
MVVAMEVGKRKTDESWQKPIKELVVTGAYHTMNGNLTSFW